MTIAAYKVLLILLSHNYYHCHSGSVEELKEYN